MNWFQVQIANIIFAAVPIGTLAFLIGQQSKRLSLAIDTLPVWQKRLGISIISIALTSIFAWAKVPNVCVEGIDCLTSLDSKTIEAILDAGLGAIVAMLIHKQK